MPGPTTRGEWLRRGLAELPQPGRLAMPFAVLLGLELLSNRVLTRISIFLPAGAATPMTAVAVLGSVLMTAAALLAFVALLSIVVHGRGEPWQRALAAASFLALVAFLAVPAAGIAAVILPIGGIAAFLSRPPRWPEGVFSILIVGGLTAIATYELVLASSAAGVYVAGEILILAALCTAGLRVLVERRGARPTATATAVVAFLLLLYLRAPSGFAAVAIWSLGYGLFLPPLFFAAIWFMIAAVLAEKSLGRAESAASLALFLFAGIDVRVTYVMAALVFAAALRQPVHFVPAAKPRDAPAELTTNG